MAAAPSSGPLFKPRDKVVTPNGRLAIVVAVLRGGEREIQMVDGDKEFLVIRTCNLTLVEDAKPRPWPSHRAPT